MVSPTKFWSHSNIQIFKLRSLFIWAGYAHSHPNVEDQIEAGRAPPWPGINRGRGVDPPARIKNRGRPLQLNFQGGSTPVFYSDRGVDPPPPHKCPPRQGCSQPRTWISYFHIGTTCSFLDVAAKQRAYNLLFTNSQLCL
jgi:hypothetical protein